MPAKKSFVRDNESVGRVVHSGMAAATGGTGSAKPNWPVTHRGPNLAYSGEAAWELCGPGNIRLGPGMTLYAANTFSGLQVASISPTVGCHESKDYLPRGDRFSATPDRRGETSVFTALV
jgi:hypothetical protein